MRNIQTPWGIVAAAFMFLAAAALWSYSVTRNAPKPGQTLAPAVDWRAAGMNPRELFPNDPAYGGREAVVYVGSDGGH